ncbi:MAG: ABC-2 type transport system ATP-binding protein [Anaerolineaceae bacterium]|nr:MAG: ABC-2 type transport system ATP-binding protein [Anaerolineaceae bacterium]
MPAIELTHITKSFGAVKAVDDCSFSIEKGELFGLLGPNGAGKTTAIRCMLDIFKPDSGSVAILGGAMSEAKKDKIGYMPEERGLYQDIPLDRCLAYLGSLKGLSRSEVRQRSEGYLERFDLAAHKHKKVKELSKGMQQKAQVIATLLHQPELLIVDEPFSGLDPVNTQMIKDLLREQRAAGVTVVLCSHQMHLVEELCDRIVLIDHGRVMLYGDLAGVRRQFAGNAVLVKTGCDLPALPGVERVEPVNGAVKLHLAPGAQPQEILRALVAKDIPLEQFEIAVPTLDEIFIRVVQGKGAAA